MPKMVLTAAFVSLNTVDRSGDCSKVELSMEVEEKDVTVFASLGWKAVTGGLKSGSLALSLKNDLAAGALDESMWTLFGTVVPFKVRAVNTVASPSNPEYSGSVLVKSWSPVAGSPGDVNELSVTYPTSGAIARATA